jgi:hypothetical protein
VGRYAGVNEINGLTDSISLFFNEWSGLTERAAVGAIFFSSSGYDLYFDQP